MKHILLRALAVALACGACASVSCGGNASTKAKTRQTEAARPAALEIDDEIDPPMFKISDTHFAATWLLDPRAPKVEMPPELKDRVARMSAEAKKIEEAE